MNEYGERPEAGTLVFRRVLPGPIERVWDYLTDSRKRGRWLASGEMELRIGGKVELHFHNAELSPVNAAAPEKYKSMENTGSFSGTITQLDPPRLLAFTWAESEGIKSEVTFELAARDSEVDLRLTHRRLPRDRETLLSVSAGWHTHLGILADKLSNRQPAPFWTTHTRLENEYDKLIGL